MSRKVLRGRPSDQPYLHKDFHGALSFALDYVDERFGAEALRELLKRVAGTVYSPLIRRAKEVGLDAIREHFCEVFAKESGDFEVTVKDRELVFVAKKCPALSHMREQGYRVATHFCETTRVVNETIAQELGWQSSVEYDQENGACTQRFSIPK